MRPLDRFRWSVTKRMRAGELDRDLGTLLLAMSTEMEHETPEAGVTVRGLQARYLDLYERLEEPGLTELLTRTRAVSQMVALERSIRASYRGSGKVRGSSSMWTTRTAGADDAPEASGDDVEEQVQQQVEHEDQGDE
jgi:hypothetical protein